jgi:hypothetical protein
MAQLEMPSIGFLHEAGGTWRAVYGVAGSFVLGPVTDEPEQLELDRVLERHGVKLSTTEEELILQYADGHEARFSVSGVGAVRAMSPDYAQVSAGGREYALRLKQGHESLFLLPGVTE